MSKIINKKTPKQFYLGDRQLLRDTRLTSDAKNLYQVLSSLAESCDNVCPSYLWLAQEIGYNLFKDEAQEKSKNINTINRFIGIKIAELEKLEMIKQIRTQTGNDYEVYDYIPDISDTPKKSSGTHQKSQVGHTKKVKSYNKEKEDIRNKINKKENLCSKELTELQKINIEAISNYANKLKENINEFNLIAKSKVDWLIQQNINEKIAKETIENELEKLINWLKNQKDKNLSPSPNPKNRFWDWIKKSGELKFCYSYPKKEYNNQNNPQIPKTESSGVPPKIDYNDIDEDWHYAKMKGRE
jgi:hypothetical protein